jgi:hypothetical protein
VSPVSYQHFLDLFSVGHRVRKGESRGGSGMKGKISLCYRRVKGVIDLQGMTCGRLIQTNSG